MKEYVLNYYPEFKCIAQNCKHTCCKDWETCIDKQTLIEYKKEASSFSNKLKNGVNFKKSTFKRGKDKRCAFLNDKGLCEIISNLGEERLCQICRDHPRFKSGFSGVTETGLGFCCEEAGRIIFSFDKKIEPVLVKDDNACEEFDFCEKAVLNFRSLVLDILQDRTTSINDRVNKVLSISNADFNKSDFLKIIKTYLSLKRLNKSWTLRLKSLKSKPFNFSVMDSLSVYCEQFLVNSVYRHLSTADDIVRAQSIIVAIVFSWLLIQNIYSVEVTQNEEFATIVDVTREFSAEVEYCPQNLTKLFNFTNKFIK